MLTGRRGHDRAAAAIDQSNGARRGEEAPGACGRGCVGAENGRGEDDDGCGELGKSERRQRAEIDHRWQQRQEEDDHLRIAQVDCQTGQEQTRPPLRRRVRGAGGAGRRSPEFPCQVEKIRRTSVADRDEDRGER